MFRPGIGPGGTTGPASSSTYAVACFPRFTIAAVSSARTWAASPVIANAQSRTRFNTTTSLSQITPNHFPIFMNQITTLTANSQYKIEKTHRYSSRLRGMFRRYRSQAILIGPPISGFGSLRE
jgi:hypothetical protein